MLVFSKTDVTLVLDLLPIFLSALHSLYFTSGQACASGKHIS